jgi:hypothetical protein
MRRSGGNDVNVLLYKSETGTTIEMSSIAARGMIDGFVRGGSAINVIEGGVRIQVPGGHYWELTAKAEH